MPNLSNQIDLLRKQQEDIAAETSYLKALKDDYETNRLAVMVAMQAEGALSHKTATAQVSIATKTDVKVTDPKLVLAWLEANQFHVEEYLTLDTPRIKELAKGRLKEDGEIVAGMEAVTTQVLTVKEVKQKQ